MFCFLLTEAVGAIWALSFDEENRKVMVGNEEQGVVSTLLNLKAVDNDKIKAAANGTLWNLRKELEKTETFHELGRTIEPCHKIMVLFIPVNSYLKRACSATEWARCLIFGQTLRLLPYFMWANSEGSGETVQMRRLAWAFAGHLCDKYHNLMSCMTHLLLVITLFSFKL